jgi:hypothetical protein
MLTFTHTADLPYPPDELMRRLSAGSGIDSRWTLAETGRDLYFRSEHVNNRNPSVVATTSSHLRAEEILNGARLIMTVTFSAGGAIKYLIRPWLRRRVAVTFSGLLYALETGDLRRMDQRRIIAVHELRFQIAILVVLLLLTAVVVAFLALLSWPLAVLMAVFNILAASRPIRRIRATRRRLRG